MRYIERTIDKELAGLLGEVPAVSIVGAKGVGKTETAKQLAGTVLHMDVSAPARALAVSLEDLAKVTRRPVLIDEWPRAAQSWDNVRHIVDSDPSPNRFILTGSTSGKGYGIHSGAGRIVQLHMRPMSLEERGLAEQAVSISEILDGASYSGLYEQSPVGFRDYAHEIFASGFPGIRGYSDQGIKALVQGYIDAIVEKEFEELGVVVRKPNVLRAWLTAYAAATATTTSYAKILRASTPGEERMPSKDTTLVYRDALDRLYLTERVDPWLPTPNPIATLGRSQKHFLVDPALALALLKKPKNELLTSTQELGVGSSRDNSVFGRLFENLVAISLRVYAQGADADLYHFRTSDGRHEVDFIIERGDDLLGIEVKLSPQVNTGDGNGLNWLEDRLDGSRRLTKILINTGTHAYRQPDDILVVPLALLGS
ncbi:MAG: DUF4143 domain-containing protein [Eggerthellaceae bacterium]|nr:DUF4143 domain-containing protein [Eggerthellaceae bacterium]